MRMLLLVGCAALLSAPAEATEPSASLPAMPEHGFPLSLAPAYITDLQQQLIARGYYAGPADGRMNGALRAAVSVYQSDVGLRVTGVPDLAVVNMLHFGPDVRATIQPLGMPSKPAVVAARGGVPPYQQIEPYRYPDQPAAPEPVTEAPKAVEAVRCEGAANGVKPRADRRALRAEEPPPPTPAPQAKVASQPLAPVAR